MPVEIIRAPTDVIGYHGCSLESANRLLGGEPFIASENEYDWLGQGVYFWEYAPQRAIEWAQRFYPKQPAVLKAKISLGHCLNLLDTEHFAGIERSYEQVVETAAKNGVQLQINQRKWHNLDQSVIEYYCRDYADISGNTFHTVRGCFPEGKRLYEGSHLRSKTHVQIAVRDVAQIALLERIPL